MKFEREREADFKNNSDIAVNETRKNSSRAYVKETQWKQKT